MKKNYLLIPTILILVGCSTSYPLYVKNQVTDEVFIGKATSQLFGKSDFLVSNPDGVTCTGKYDATVIVNPMEGTSNTGTMDCTDGRKGTWVVSGSGTSGGQGVGKLDGKKIIIMYGSMARVSGF
jgi:hypothetical protein